MDVFIIFQDFRDIEIAISQQCRYFLYSIIFGIVLAVIYDIFRIIRIAFKHSAIVVFFEDILYCLIWTLSLIMLIFCANYGVIRWFSLFGSIAGFYIYYNTIGRIVISLANVIISFIKKVIMSIVRPIVRFTKFIYKISRRWLFEIKQKYKILYNLLRDRVLKRKLIKSAQRGFGLKL